MPWRWRNYCRSTRSILLSIEDGMVSAPLLCHILLKKKPNEEEYKHRNLYLCWIKIDPIPWHVVQCMDIRCSSLIVFKMKLDKWRFQPKLRTTSLKTDLSTSTVGLLCIAAVQMPTAADEDNHVPLTGGWILKRNLTLVVHGLFKKQKTLKNLQCILMLSCCSPSLGKVVAKSVFRPAAATVPRRIEKVAIWCRYRWF